MPTLAVIGDVHAKLARLDRVIALLAPSRPDLALFVGDMGADPPWAEPARSRDRERHDVSVREVVRRVRAALACPAVFVPGNHDLPLPPGDVDAVNADRTVVTVAGLRVAGLGGAGPARFGFPYEWTEEEADTRMRESLSGAGEIDVFLCHTPPFGGQLDRLPDGTHVGSRAVAEWIPRLAPRVFLCGHIHEAWGLERTAGVPCVNAGALGEPYGQVIGWTIEWDDGPTAIDSWQLLEGGEVRRRSWLDG